MNTDEVFYKPSINKTRILEELDVLILLKVEQLKRPVKWDMDSVPESIIGEGNKLIQTYANDNICCYRNMSVKYTDNYINDNYMRNEHPISYAGDCLIGIYALRPVKFSIKIGYSFHREFSLNAGEYIDDIIYGYPLVMIALSFLSPWIIFDEGHINDVCFMYCWLPRILRIHLRSHIITIPLPLHIQTNSYNCIEFSKSSVYNVFR